ncbi:hypothetical protein [Spirochaeta cellobiosiphila]|uniref:hypothetical protein n=1 Tax=Spirochaeta cellobiosiphila TaxID=504483 RepID=UPI00040942D8|nr:hypothetical protein [Spirochaeta cellobiosiphila]
MKHLTTILLFLLPLAVFGETTVLLNSGHKGEVSQIVYDNSSNLIFTSSTDGSIKAWDIRTKDLARVVYQSSHPIKTMDLNPEKPQLTILESNNLDYFRIKVINWKTGKVLYSQSFETEPISFSYSTQGTYLLINKVDIPSMTILDTEKFKETKYLQDINSVISFAYLGSSDKTVMTYSSNGSLSFWDLKTGLLKAKADTINDLKNWRITNNKLYMTAAKGNVLYVIDRLTGKVVSQKEIPGLESDDINYNEDHIAVIKDNNGSNLIQHYTFKNDHYEEAAFHSDASESQISTLTYAQGMIITGDYRGDLNYFYIRSDKQYSLATNVMQNVDDVSIRGDELWISTDEALYQIKSPFFTSSNIEDLSQYTLKSHKDLNSHIISTAGANYFLFPTSGNSAIVEFTNDNQIKNSPYSTGAIKKIDYKEGQNLILTDNGEIKVFNTDFTDVSFQYSFLGLLDASFYKDNKIVGSHVARRGSPLLLLDYTTGETLPIDDSASIIYSLVGSDDKLFTLGVDKSSGQKITELNQYSGDLLMNKKTLLSIEGEELNYNLHFDQDLFTTFPDHQVHQYVKDKWVDLEPTETFPLRIKSSKELVIAVNKDQSISFWNRKTGSYLGAFSLLFNDEWVFINHDKYYGSEDIEDHLSFIYN